MKYFIHIGQDCSTLRLLGYCAKRATIIPFFFDGFAIYSDDWKKVFTRKFMENEVWNISVFLKTPPSKVLALYEDCIKTGYDSKPRRIDVHGFIGDQYNRIYFDDRHAHNEELKKLLDLSSFEKFYSSIETEVYPFLKQQIEQNIRNTKVAYEQHAMDDIVFIRTVKHLMSDVEHEHLLQVRKRIKEMFPNSTVLVISDVWENSCQNNDISYMKFQHWNTNSEDKSSFLSLLHERKILDS